MIQAAAMRLERRAGRCFIRRHCGCSRASPGPPLHPPHCRAPRVADQVVPHNHDGHTGGANVLLRARVDDAVPGRRAGGMGWDGTGASIEAVCALGSASCDPAMPGRLLFQPTRRCHPCPAQCQRGQRPHLLTSTGLDRKLLLISATSTLPPTSGAPCGAGGVQSNAEPAAEGPW